MFSWVFVFISPVQHQCYKTDCHLRSWVYFQSINIRVIKTVNGNTSLLFYRDYVYFTNPTIISMLSCVCVYFSNTHFGGYCPKIVSSQNFKHLHQFVCGQPYNEPVHPFSGVCSANWRRWRTLKIISKKSHFCPKNDPKSKILDSDFTYMLVEAYTT